MYDMSITCLHILHLDKLLLLEIALYIWSILREVKQNDKRPK